MLVISSGIWRSGKPATSYSSGDEFAAAVVWNKMQYGNMFDTLLQNCRCKTGVLKFLLLFMWPELTKEKTVMVQMRSSGDQQTEWHKVRD